MKKSSKSKKELSQNDLKLIQGSGNCNIYVKPLNGLKDGKADFGNELLISINTVNETACQAAYDSAVDIVVTQAVSKLKELDLNIDQQKEIQSLLDPKMMGRYEFTNVKNKDSEDELDKDE